MITMAEALAKVRPSVRGNNARGLKAAELNWVEYNYTSKFKKSKKGAQGAGHRFEAKVVKELEAQFGTFVSGIPFVFSTDYSPRTVCIPDGLIIWDKEVLIIEVKLSHTVDSWFQLRKLYGPVVGRALNRKVRLLEICKTYYKEESFPEPYRVYPSIGAFLLGGDDLGCVIWGS